MNKIAKHEHLEDSANASVFESARQRFVADSDGLGHMRRGRYDWLQQHPAAKIIVLPEVYAEEVSGENLIARTNKGFAAFLRHDRASFMRQTGIVAHQTERLTKAQDALLEDKLVAQELQQAPRRLVSALVAATAIEYGIPVLSGNSFYVRVAERFEMPGGAYDVYRGKWIVPCTIH